MRQSVTLADGGCAKIKVGRRHASDRRGVASVLRSAAAGGKGTAVGGGTPGLSCPPGGGKGRAVEIRYANEQK